jgi:BA14K-like protein
MQFLVYLTVLMVSVSTVLLEVHWLTSPPPQPKATVRTAAKLVPIPKAEGPNPELSPVYPKAAPKPDENASDTRQPTTSAGSTAAQPTQKPAAETTGVAARAEESRGTSADVANGTSKNSAGAAAAAQPVQAAAAQPVTQPVQGESTASNNRCDVQSCSNAYKSFRASDCTYQPFDGPRRFCAKPPVQRTARDQRDDRESRKSTREIEFRDTGSRSRWRAYDDDDDEPDFADDDGRPLVIHRGPRW